MALLGKPAPLHSDLLSRLNEAVAGGRAFLIEAEREDTLQMVLRLVDQTALGCAPVTGNA